MSEYLVEAGRMHMIRRLRNFLHFQLGFLVSSSYFRYSDRLIVIKGGSVAGPWGWLVGVMNIGGILV